MWRFTHKHPVQRNRGQPELNLEAIQRKIEAEGLHFTEGANGAAFICVNSLRK